MKTWTIVADASRARIFETNGVDNELREMRTLVHPASRLKTSDLVSDRSGRIGKPTGRAAMEARTTAHDVEADEFAAILADEMDKALEHRQCSSLVLVVPPRFLGRLRSVISHRVLNAVTKTIEKELTQCSADELAAALSVR